MLSNDNTGTGTQPRLPTVNSSKPPVSPCLVLLAEAFHNVASLIFSGYLSSPLLMTAALHLSNQDTTLVGSLARRSRVSKDMAEVTYGPFLHIPLQDFVRRLNPKDGGHLICPISSADIDEDERRYQLPDILCRPPRRSAS